MGFGEWLKNVLSHKNDFSSFFFSWRRTPTLNSKKQVCHYHAKIRLDEMSYFIFSFSYLDLMIKSNCSDAFYPAQIKCIMFYDAFFPPYTHLWFKLYSSGENETLHSCNSTTTLLMKILYDLHLQNRSKKDLAVIIFWGEKEEICCDNNIMIS